MVLLLIISFGIPATSAAEVSINVDQDSSIVKVLGDIHVSKEQEVVEDVVAVLGDIKIDGKVNGDVVAVLGDIEINNSIGGDLVSLLGTIDQAPQTYIAGDVVEVDGFQTAWEFDLPFILLGWGFKILKLIVVYGLAVLVVALFPTREKTMTAALAETPVKKLGIGSLCLLLLPVFILLSVISIIGLPLVPVIVLAFLIIQFIGSVAVALLVGQRIKATANLEVNILVELLFGVVALWLVKSIPILGALAYLVIAAFSLGVVVDTKFGAASSWLNLEGLERISDSDEEGDEEE